MTYGKMLAVLSLSLIMLAGCGNETRVIEAVDNRADLPSTVTRKDLSEEEEESVVHFVHEETDVRTDSDRRLVLDSSDTQPFAFGTPAVTEDQIYFVVVDASFQEESDLLKVTFQISNLSPYSYQIDLDNFEITNGEETYSALEDDLLDPEDHQNLTNQVLTPNSSLCGSLYFSVPEQDLSEIKLDVFSQGNLLAQFLLQ